MIDSKVFDSLEQLNKFNDEYDVRVISIKEKRRESIGEGGTYFKPKYVSITEIELTVWYETNNNAKNLQKENDNT
jgi:hypothetical protein